MSDELEVSIDDSAVREALRETKAGLPGLIDQAAGKLQAELEARTRGVSARLSQSWELDLMGDSDSRVFSGLFFAGWLSRGTAGHGPAKASRLVFQVDGDVVRTGFVSGTPANPFAEQSIAATEAAMPDLLDRLLAEASA